MSCQCSWTENKSIYVFVSINDGDTFWQMRR